MVHLLSRLQQTCPTPLDLVVHVGAGALASPTDYAALQPGRLLLVEADPQAAARLHSSFSRSTPETRIVEKLLLPHSGPASLFKFNLPALNGIQPAGALHTLYPNLRLLEELPLNGESFSAFLESLPLESDAPRLLVLDVPGQEGALLESLAYPLTERFEWILLRGSSPPLQEGSNPLSSAVSLLQGRFFEPVAADSDTDPAWPLQLLRLNRHHAALRHALDARTRLIESQSAQITTQSLHIAQLEQDLSEHAATAAQLADTRAELETRTRLLLEKATEIGLQSQRLSQLEPQLVQHQSHCDSLQSELQSSHNLSAAHAQNLAAAAEKLEHSQAHLQAVAAQITELETELETRARLLVEKASVLHLQSERLSQLEPQLAHLQSHCDSLQGELQAARDLAAAHAQNLAATSEQLQHSQAQLQAVETQRTDLNGALASQKTLVQALSKGRSEQDRLHAELVSERDALRESLAAAQLRLSDSEAQLAAKEARTALVDAEFQKVEGQMDLIRGLVFRDHGR
jgi:hypothetical protein